jgi:Uncharacterized protein involved in methicillin resistance
MQLKELTNEEFLQFTSKHKYSSIYQTPEYGMAMNKQNMDAFYLGLYDDYGSMFAATLILVEMLGKFQYATAPRGFLIDYNDEVLVKEFTNMIKKYLRKKNIIALKISPLIIRNTYNKNEKTTIQTPNYDHIYAYLKKLGYYHLGYNNYFEANKPRFEAIIPLSPSSPVMFSKISKEFKTKIRSSDKTGVRIYKADERYLEYFYKLTQNKYPRDLKYFQDLYNLYKNRDAVDLYFALLDTKYFLINTQREFQKQSVACNKITDEIFKNQGKANASLINRKIVEDNKLAALKNQLVDATALLNKSPDGIIAACAILIKHQKEVYLLMDGYDVNYKKINAKHLLIWKLMEKYGSEGFQTFNLGGMTNYLEKESQYKGLNDFKLGFGANSVEYIGDLEIITNYPLYMLYRNSAPLRNLGKK